jgi:hypothetical protein
MPPESPRPARLRLFVLTCRDPKSDFRLPLADALRRDHETYYIWVRRRPVVSGPKSGDTAVELSLLAFLRFIRRFRRDDAINVYFNSTNTYFPGLSALLRLVAPAGVWCLDMHDDLRYHNKGLKRWRESLLVSLLRRLSHVTVHAAPTLQELFPDSRHLGNASNILPLARNDRPNDGVLVLASFDERFDFDFLSDLAQACPTIQFHLHGWTRPDDTPTMVQITSVNARHANVHYHGPYKMADLPSILRAYRVSVAPYRTDTMLTHYIDPLRFYHCLNAGLEVVSTDIPQARYMRDWVHVVADVADCADRLAAIRSGELAKQPAYSPITWQQRADTLVEILRRLPRTAGLIKGRVTYTNGPPASAGQRPSI